MRSSTARQTALLSDTPKFGEVEVPDLMRIATSWGVGTLIENSGAPVTG